MDPIHPIIPGPAPIPRGMAPVDRLERLSRERDRPAKDRQQQPRREPPAPEPEDGEDDGRPHVDIRV
jgi:hypothetical protein